jgi:hypothetical protein
MPTSTGDFRGRRRFRWWIPDYPKRLGWRDVGQIASTAVITAIAAVLFLGVGADGGLVRWLAGLTVVLGLFGLVGIGIGLLRSRGAEDGPAASR